jgi:hypothetical protein
MKPHLRRPVILAVLFGVIAVLTAATQGQKFPGGVFKTSDGTNTIALDFDSTGALNVYVNNESFSNGTWSVKADTLTFGRVQGPEGYACASEARYLWALAENQITFKPAGEDDCQTRRDGLLGMIWTKGLTSQ